jgi:hypothetical protein
VQIEREFQEMSATTNAAAAGAKLPFGFGVGAFRDSSFPVFPSFPVLHKVHYEIFGTVIPSVFRNQEADPYLFQVRNGVAPKRSLVNNIPVYTRSRK